MTIRPTIATIFAMVIFAVAMMFAGGAYAHSGHEHQAERAASVHSGVPSHDAVKMVEQGNEAEEAAAIAEGRQQPAIPGKTGGCSGNCCGNGMGCCGAVLMAPPTIFPEAESANTVTAFDFSHRPGVDPAGLRRPPRVSA